MGAYSVPMILLDYKILYIEVHLECMHGGAIIYLKKWYQLVLFWLSLSEQPRCVSLRTRCQTLMSQLLA